MFYNVLIFLLVLFIYIHITHQLKRSEDLEIYELDYTTNIHLQEVCDVKQPVLFELKSFLPEYFENVSLDNLSKYGTYDIKIKDINDYFNEDASLDYVYLPYQSSQNLMSTDPKSVYFTENNEEFIEETGYIEEFKDIDNFIKPSMTIQTKYDFMCGSHNCITPLRYHTNNRHFLTVNSGKITIKMTPWRSHKYIHLIKDFENYEFRSPINVWQPQPKYARDMDKIKFLEFDVNPGYVLYIPPYWFYSIKFSGENTLLTTITYNSIMNHLANLHNLGLYFIQQQNIKKKVAKTMEFEIVDDETAEEKEGIPKPKTISGIKIIEKKPTN